ncbi:MAG: polysaccharide deacetylase family protein [Lautropia sp.]|nr:polysaccharide deacetylase family protein [Lautropia sp.]
MNAVTVLMYHAIVDGEAIGADAHYSVAPATFAHQLHLIQTRGRRVCSVSQLLNEACSIAHRQPPVCLTFDDGHLSNAGAAEIIARCGGQAEFFVNPAMVGQPGFLDWSALRDMAAMGMSIQSHGMHHRYLDQLSPPEVEAELAQSKAAIEDAIGKPVQVYAPAGGRMPAGFMSLARRLGYAAVCTSRVGLWSWPADHAYTPGQATAAATSPSSNPRARAVQDGAAAAAIQSSSALDIPRLAMLHSTSDARFLAWITQHPLEMLKQQTRYRVLRLSKQILGNGGHERLRRLLLGHDKTASSQPD